MKESQITIIALFARGREIGFVLMENGELFRYGVKTIKGKRRGENFTRRAEDALSPLLFASRPQGLIVIERKPNTPTQGALCKAICQMSKRWKQRGYSLSFISLGEVKQSLCDTQKATHRELMEAIVERYPILWPLITGAKGEKRKYWEKVFIAMALAEVVRSRLEKKRFEERAKA